MAGMSVCGSIVKPCGPCSEIARSCNPCPADARSAFALGIGCPETPKAEWRPSEAWQKQPSGRQNSAALSERAGKSERLNPVPSANAKSNTPVAQPLPPPLPGHTIAAPPEELFPPEMDSSVEKGLSQAVVAASDIAMSVLNSPDPGSLGVVKDVKDLELVGEAVVYEPQGTQERSKWHEAAIAAAAAPPDATQRSAASELDLAVQPEPDAAAHQDVMISPWLAEVKEDQNEPEPEEAQKLPVDEVREYWKSRVALLGTATAWALLFIILAAASSTFTEPVCTADMVEAAKKCEQCGTGTIVLPLYGEFENSWPNGFRSVLYFTGLIWCFLGVGIVCDQFMGAIEAITATQHVVWIEVHRGARHKFSLNVWNGTVANLTLMALGSSAPEILLSIIELTGNNMYAGELGPSTIVGSAAFNLLVITGVCVAALPAGTTKSIQQTGVFLITATASLFAYLWLLIILVAITPNKVDPAEAVLTFFFFPLLVTSAYLADRGFILGFLQPSSSCGSANSEDDDLMELRGRLEARFGKPISAQTAKLILQAEAQTEEKQDVSLAKRRSVITDVMTGRKSKKDDVDLSFGFKEKRVTCLPCMGMIRLSVRCNRPPGVPATLNFCTIDGSARAGANFEHTEGALTFEPDQTEAHICVRLVENPVTTEHSQDFIVELYDLTVSGNAITSRTAGRASAMGVQMEPVVRFETRRMNVTIVSDDFPGVLSFEADEVKTVHGTSVTLAVHRNEGARGLVTCSYETQDVTAAAGSQYQKVEGTLTWADGETLAKLQVPIIQEDTGERRFRVVLSNPRNGVKFDPNREGGEHNAFCEVIIAQSDEGTMMGRVRQWYDPEKMSESLCEWLDQFESAVYCNGSAEDQSEAEPMDWFFHVLSVPWKIFFALVPPPSIAGGWLCFVAALGFIGLVTAVVGDMAGLLGCCVGMSDDITAITLVALGTSLPDTFASKAAAQADESADNSVGNVTGSNSVNVFLGLGLPWTMAAFYWQDAGVTAEWRNRPIPGSDLTYAEQFLTDYPEGGFMVPADGLGFSVLIFSLCALMCLALLGWRRTAYGGELGGPKPAQMRDFAFLVSLWFLYIISSIAYSVSR